MHYGQIAGGCGETNSSRRQTRVGAVLRWGRGARVPRSICCPPQIQKLADRSDVISEVQKCSKIQFFGAPDPAGGA